MVIHSHYPNFLINRRSFAKIMPSTINSADVWIGNGVLIKAGMTIGVGEVIGAGSIVTKGVPPLVIAAGNPCRQIRPRYTED
jgi:acetyltransferase-like isoleucine patch superfamily enzyme